MILNRGIIDINMYLFIRHENFGGKLKEIEPIPYLGLRGMDSESNKFLLISDIWKYNYSILTALSW